ncbi:hypothetical protein [Alteribacter natronophilus]|nr:hypothetical protein [Alteribacter natronophilus]
MSDNSSLGYAILLVVTIFVFITFAAGLGASSNGENGGFVVIST